MFQSVTKLSGKRKRQCPPSSLTNLSKAIVLSSDVTEGNPRKELMNVSRQISIFTGWGSFLFIFYLQIQKDSGTIWKICLSCGLLEMFITIISKSGYIICIIQLKSVEPRCNWGGGGWLRLILNIDIFW